MAGKDPGARTVPVRNTVGNGSRSDREIAGSLRRDQLLVSRRSAQRGQSGIGAQLRA